MGSHRFDADTIRKLLIEKKIATMPELKDALGTNADVTVFRKLQELAYRSSYSHRGRYYTLDEVPDFDRLGLWSFRQVWFSRYGTLLSTAEALVEESEAGCFAEELEGVVHVGVNDTLRHLTRANRLCRERLRGRFLYVSCDPSIRNEQLRSRHAHEEETSTSLGFTSGLRVLPDELKAAIILFYSLLDEKQRRLYAGLESLKLGHGGDKLVAELLGLDPKTVAKGRCQLMDQDVEVGRTRRAGAGRKATEKKRQRSSGGSKKS
jgi:hypothetical protein